MRLLPILLLVGCTESSPQESEVIPSLTKAEKIFLQEVMPILHANCTACHGTGAFEYGFLDGESWWEIRDSLLDSPVIDLDPTRSRFLTKGAHSGPALSAQQAAAIVEWLEAERDNW